MAKGRWSACVASAAWVRRALIVVGAVGAIAACSSAPEDGGPVSVTLAKGDVRPRASLDPCTAQGDPAGFDPSDPYHFEPLLLRDGCAKHYAVVATAESADQPGTPPRVWRTGFCPPSDQLTADIAANVADPVAARVMKRCPDGRDVVLYDPKDCPSCGGMQ